MTSSPRVRTVLRGAAALGLAVALASCATGFRRFPAEPPVLEDPDRRPVSTRPETYFSGQLGDAVDQSVFRPMSRALVLPRDGEAVDVNAMDEVPRSSWYEPRLGTHPISPERLARAACDDEIIRSLRAGEGNAWSVIGAKPDGANPGFLVENADGIRFLMKFDVPHQPERATAADVLGSIMFWGAGYLAPCNRITTFRREDLTIAEGATAERADGTEVPLDDALIEQVLGKGRRLPDGRYRGMASQFLPGRPIGPFRYEGTRRDDPNDVIPHELRRELRAARLMAAWTRRFDSREQNTLNIWVENPRGPGGWVEHFYIDFGDCFGDLLADPALNPRIGHAYYVDFGYLFADFFTLGIIERPWDRPRYGPGGRTFSYYAVDDFDPATWKPGYGNPAFEQMTERDAAWLARVLAHFTDDHLEAAVAETRFTRPELTDALFAIVAGRRDRLLSRYLTRLSPLTQPHVSETPEGAVMCLRDLAVVAGVIPASARTYAARAWRQRDRGRPEEIPVGEAVAAHGHDACVLLPAVERASTLEPAYLIVDVLGALGAGDQTSVPTRVHLYQTGPRRYDIAGLERPADRAPPGS